MRVLLISTYELGRQPVHLAGPAAALRESGHEVRVVDLSVSPLEDEDITWAERVAVSVPMHTATRLADEVVAALRELRSDLPVAFYGLYAAVGAEPVAARFEGEYEPALLAWADGGESGAVRHLGRSDFAAPDRVGLPDLGEYARLEHRGANVLVGAVEASHGCRHRCRHCPIPAVYDGRMRVVPPDLVVADIDRLVAAGAGHITFGDADFLNAPAHSLAVLERAHRTHPEVSFDATIKVEHILDHRNLWPRLAEMNLLFVVSAFESVDGPTLDVLDKGHTVDDMSEAVAVTRESGVHIRPTWLPFLPWTTPEDVAGIFTFIDDHDLAGATDPVQMAIRLLIPPGSLLEDHPAVVPYRRGYDDRSLTWAWDFAEPETAVLQKELETIAADASDCGQEALQTLNEMREVVARRSGISLAPISAFTPVPRLTESWFCCAEPTRSQSVSIRGRR